MKNEIKRRHLLKLGLAGGAGALGGAFLACSPEKKEKNNKEVVFPWPYSPLDPEKVALRAYKNHYKGGCMYAVFEAIAGTAAEILGEAYTSFPFELSTFGGGGIAGWGSICGTCNGAAMAVAMFFNGKKRSIITKELLSWYESEPLPGFVPREPRNHVPVEMAKSRAGSVLCHPSLVNWSVASGFPDGSKEARDRCGRLGASVAAKAVELMNSVVKGEHVPGPMRGEVASRCLGCHENKEKVPVEQLVSTDMNCSPCHNNSNHYNNN